MDLPRESAASTIEYVGLSMLVTMLVSGVALALMPSDWTVPAVRWLMWIAS